jgi:hypothetical protein
VTLIAISVSGKQCRPCQGLASHCVDDFAVSLLPFEVENSFRKGPKYKTAVKILLQTAKSRPSIKSFIELVAEIYFEIFD